MLSTYKSEREIGIDIAWAAFLMRKEQSLFKYQAEIEKRAKFISLVIMFEFWPLLYVQAFAF